jgi:glycosyltransferase involved in cell wall biosynthesis
MRILWSIHLYPPAHNCGSEWMAHNINQFLITRGHHCRVILHYYNGDPYILDGVEVFPATGIVDAYRWADLIITHLDMTQYTILMAKQAKKSLVHFVHNDIPYSSILNNFGNVSAVYNSQWIADKIGYKIPGYVLHPPCDVNNYNTEDKIGIDCGSGVFKKRENFDREFITLISLNERKGGYLFYQIAKAMPDKKFLGVIGSYDNVGPLKMIQMEIINLLIQLPNFTLVPNTPDILSTYRRTRILLMPSDYESWGRTATEAMCSGIPVICTPTPGLRENCGEAAIYVGKPIDGEPGEAQVDTGEVKDWVKAIRRLDDPKEYQKYSVLCSNRAAELDPLKELEGLEQFLITAANSYRHGPK